MSCKPYIVAEMSGNHCGSLERALKIVDAADWAGADAIKLQTYNPEEMVLDGSYIIKEGLWEGQNLKELYKKSHTPREWHSLIFEHVRDKGMECFSTPYSKSDVDFLETLNCPRYKVASLEITDLDLISYIAETEKPIMISTGGASRKEIEAALTVSWKNLVTLMKCTVAYPAEERNLVTILAMAREFNIDVGLSDHSIGTDDAIIATSLGASVIEKHLTLGEGPDSVFSLDPVEFKLLVNKVRYTAKALGKVKYGPIKGEMLNLRRSLYFTQDMSKGDYLCPHHVVSARPALGITGIFENNSVFMLNKDIKAGQPVTEDSIIVADNSEKQ